MTSARGAVPVHPGGARVSEVELGRRRYRTERQYRSVAVSVLSTVVFAGVLTLSVVNTPGWEAVQRSFLDPDVARRSFLPILQGLWLNVRVLVVAALAVGLLGGLIAVSRTLRGPVFAPVRLAAAAYTDTFRGLPLILVLYIVGFGLPGLGIFPRMEPWFWGSIAIVLTYSAYVAEVLRAGIEAVHPSQVVAARSLGLSHGRTLRLVVMPQAVRKVTPALMNDFVAMQKDVGLISVLGAVDAVRAAQLQVAATYNFTPYVVAGVLFVMLAWPMIRLTDWYSARARRREQAGAVL